MQFGVSDALYRTARKWWVFVSAHLIYSGRTEKFCNFWHKGHSWNYSAVSVDAEIQEQNKIKQKCFQQITKRHHHQYKYETVVWKKSFVITMDVFCIKEELLAWLRMGTWISCENWEISIRGCYPSKPPTKQCLWKYQSIQSPGTINTVLTIVCFHAFWDL